MENEKRRRIRARPSSVLTSSVSHRLSSSQSCTREVVQKGSTMPDGLHVCPLKYAWLLLHYCSKRKTGKLNIGVVAWGFCCSAFFSVVALCTATTATTTTLTSNLKQHPKATTKKMSGISETLSLRGTLAGHGDWVTSLATTPEDPNLLLSSSRDKSVVVWQLTGTADSYGYARRALRGHSHFVSDVVISSDGAFALSASWDSELRLWDIATGKTTRRFVGHDKDVLSVAFSVDNRQIVSGTCFFLFLVFMPLANQTKNSKAVCSFLLYLPRTLLTGFLLFVFLVSSNFRFS